MRRIGQRQNPQPRSGACGVNPPRRLHRVSLTCLWRTFNQRLGRLLIGEQGPNGSRHPGSIDGLPGVDLDQWSDAERSHLAAPQLCLDTQSVEVPPIPESVAVPISRNVERDSASHLDDLSGERTN